MDPTRFEQIAHELLDLLDQQVAVIAGRKLTDLAQRDVESYQSRKRRILELRAALGELLKSR